MMNSWAGKIKNKIAHALVRTTRSTSKNLVAYQEEIGRINAYLSNEQYQDAERLIRNLLQDFIDTADLWRLLGASFERRNPIEATVYYQRAIDLDAMHVDSYLGLAAANILLNKFKNALIFIEKAESLQPNNIKVLRSLADILCKLNKHSDALKYFKTAINLFPDDANLWCAQARCFSALNQFDSAESSFSEALKLDSKNQDVQFALGHFYQESKNYTKAIEIFKELISINPRELKHYMALAGVQLIDGQYQEAYLTQKLGIEKSDTENAEAHRQMLHICANFYGKDDEVAYHSKKVQELAPDVSHINDAVYYLRQHKFAEALSVLDQFKQLNPADTLSELNKAITLLMLGFYREGWAAYEARKQEKLVNDSSLRTSRQIPLPFWDGSPINDKSLVVVTEQGVGDCIHFVRYLPLLKSYAGTVILTCNPNVEGMFGSISGIKIARSVEDVINADYQVLLLSLPMIFKTELSNIPNTVPYLYPNKDAQVEWNRRLLPWKNQLKVGLVWAGAAVFKGDLNRSIKLSEFAPIFGVKDVTFFSLQIGVQSAQIKEKPEGADLIDLTEYIKNYADTAAFITQLDLVISVDTSVAHLAGALAVPVWILLPYFPDYRWLIEREDSPWYPTARLFRQTKHRRWDEVLFKMASALEYVNEVAIQDRQKAMAPQSRNLTLEAEINLSKGRAAYAQKDYEAAKAAFENALLLQPDLVNAWYNLGLVNQIMNHPHVAKICYERVLSLNPSDAGALHNLGCISADYKNNLEAAKYFERAWALDATNPAVAYNYSRLLWTTLDIKKGLEVQKAGLDIDPQSRLGWVNYARLLADAGDYNHVKKALIHAFQCPLLEDDELCIEEGEMLFSLGNDDTAFNAFERAKELNPKNSNAVYGQALIYLKRGEFAEGLQCLEQRLEIKSEFDNRYLSPFWDGGEMRDAILLVYSEQGLGDTIQSLRYLPMLKSKFKEIVFHLPLALAGLIHLIPEFENATVSSDEVPQHDVRISDISLHSRFNVSLETIPNNVPYLYVNQLDTVKWQSFKEMRIRLPRVGLVWAGSPDHLNDARRSIPLQMFSKLLHNKKIQWWSLQKNRDSEQLSTHDFGLVDKMGLSANLADTAALIKELDLIITVDTSVAHLAGALGKTVWILLPFNSDYRWLIGREDSPWYPSAKLFRQGNDHSWSSVIVGLEVKLQQWLVAYSK